MRFTSKKLIIGISLALMAAVPLSAGFVGTGGRGSGGGASGAYTNVVDQNAQANGYHSDIERQAAITKGYNGDDSDDANLYNAAKGRASSPYPSQHNITDSNSAAITTNHYEDDCDDYILLNSSVTGTSCTDLTKTQFLVVRSNTDAAIDNGYDTHVQFKTANLLGYTKSCADSDVYLEALGRSSSACYSTALAPPTAADCTSYISTNSLTDSSNTALTGCAAMTKTQYNGFKNWNNVQLAETAVTTATSCSGITTQNIKLFMNDQSVTNADFDFDNLSTKQSDFLKQCILDVGASRTVAQAKACGSGKDDSDLALYEIQQTRAAGTAGCGVAATYPTTGLTAGVLRRAGVWASANNTACTSAYGGNFCESNGNTVSCTNILQGDITSATSANVSTVANVSTWATAKVKANLLAQFNAWTPPHIIAEACQSANWAVPNFLKSSALKATYSTHNFKAMVAAPASNIYVYDGTGSPHSYKNMVVVGQDGDNFRIDVAANVEKRRMRHVQITLNYTNSCPAFGTGAVGSAKKMAYSVVKNAVDAAANSLASVFKPVQVESTGYLCNACQGASPPEYCDAALSLGASGQWHWNNSQIMGSTNGNGVCSGKPSAGQVGGADWSQPSGTTNVFKCVNSGCSSGQPDTYDTAIRCKAPYAGYNGTSYGNYTVSVGAASGSKKSLTASGEVAESGTMQVEWCDGTRSSVATVASGAVHSWSVNSPSPMGSSTVKIRLDTSNAIGITSQVAAAHPDTFTGSCD